MGKTKVCGKCGAFVAKKYYLVHQTSMHGGGDATGGVVAATEASGSTDSMDKPAPALSCPLCDSDISSMSLEERKKHMRECAVADAAANAAPEAWPELVLGPWPARVTAADVAEWALSVLPKLSEEQITNAASWEAAQWAAFAKAVKPFSSHVTHPLQDLDCTKLSTDPATRTREVHNYFRMWSFTCEMFTAGAKEAPARTPAVGVEALGGDKGGRGTKRGRSGKPGEADGGKGKSSLEKVWEGGDDPGDESGDSSSSPDSSSGPGRSRSGRARHHMESSKRPYDRDIGPIGEERDEGPEVSVMTDTMMWCRTGFNRDGLTFAKDTTETNDNIMRGYISDIPDLRAVSDLECIKRWIRFIRCERIQDRASVITQLTTGIITNVRAFAEGAISASPSQNDVQAVWRGLTSIMSETYGPHHRLAADFKAVEEGNDLDRWYNEACLEYSDAGYPANMVPTKAAEATIVALQKAFDLWYTRAKPIVLRTFMNAMHASSSKYKRGHANTGMNVRSAQVIEWYASSVRDRGVAPVSRYMGFESTPTQRGGGSSGTEGSSSRARSYPVYNNGGSRGGSGVKLRDNGGSGGSKSVTGSEDITNIKIGDPWPARFVAARKELEKVVRFSDMWKLVPGLRGYRTNGKQWCGYPICGGNKDHVHPDCEGFFHVDMNAATVQPRAKVNPL